MMKTLLLAFSALVLTLVVAEGAFRVIYGTRIDYQIEMSRYAALMKMDPPDPEMSHIHSPNANAHLMGVDVATNSQGFRDVERPVAKADNVYRIVLLGDSMTMGWGAPTDCRFSVGLEKALNADLTRAGSASRVEVINTGVGNYNTTQEMLMYVHFARQFKPDMVILNYFINDAEPTPSQRTSILGKYSYLYMWFWGRINTIWRNFVSKDDYKNYYANLYMDEAPGWIKTQKAFDALVAMSGQDSFRLVMAIIPELHVVGEKYGFSMTHDKVIAAARKAGFTNILDMAPSFAKQSPPALWVSPDDAHPNCDAHAIIANSLHAYLTSNNLIRK